MYMSLLYRFQSTEFKHGGDLELCHRQLISQPQRQPRMLQHMIKAQILNLVFARMNLAVAVLEVALDDKRRRISSLGSAGMITACIAALFGTISYALRWLSNRINLPWSRCTECHSTP